MADHEDSDVEFLSPPEQNNDRTALEPGKRQVNLFADYATDWTKTHAFREFCQNWWVTNMPYLGLA